MNAKAKDPARERMSFSLTPAVYAYLRDIDEGLRSMYVDELVRHAAGLRPRLPANLDSAELAGVEGMNVEDDR